MLMMHELDDMSNQEREIRYLHSFQFIAQQLSDFLVSETGKSSSTNEEYAAIKCSMLIARRLRTAIESANETLAKSPIASLLPPLEFREKLLVAAAKILCECKVICVDHLKIDVICMSLDFKGFLP
jgi:hypothetical protein